MTQFFSDGSIRCDVCNVIGATRWIECERCGQCFCEGHRRRYIELCPDCGYKRDHSDDDYET